MKKQKNRYSYYRRKDKGIKYISDGLPPKAFRQRLNRRLRARNKRIMRNRLTDPWEWQFHLFVKDAAYNYF